MEGGEIAYVLRVNAPVLSSLKPFNTGREGAGGVKERDFSRIQICTPLFLPHLLSPFLLLHTLTPSVPLYPICPLVLLP